MPHRLIVNASPLIFLSRVNGIAWLSDLCMESVEIPSAVVQEIAAGEDGQEIIRTLQIARGGRITPWITAKTQ